MKRKLTAFADAGHGWISVALKDLKTLGIEKDISEFSYMNKNCAFLEEDCDAGKFLRAARNAGWNVSIVASKSDVDYSPIRSLCRYSSRVFDIDLSVGKDIVVNGGTKVTITKKVKNGLFVSNGLVDYRIPLSNPWEYIVAQG